MPKCCTKKQYFLCCLHTILLFLPLLLLIVVADISIRSFSFHSGDPVLGFFSRSLTWMLSIYRPCSFYVLFILYMYYLFCVCISFAKGQQHIHTMQVIHGHTETKKDFFFKNRNKINMRRKRHYNIFCTRAVKVRSTVYFCYHIVLVCYVSGSDTGDNMGD